MKKLYTFFFLGAAQTFHVWKVYWKAFGLRALGRCISGFFFLAKF
jgi:hypothetical protein